MTEPGHYTITFIRHGQSTANAGGIHQGQSDFPLSEKGREQARALAARWAAGGVTYDLAIASPLSRALETAQIISSALNLPLETDPVWMERNGGKLQGLPFDDPAARALEVPFLHPYVHVGQTGESELELLARGALAVQSLLDRGPGRYLVVSHGALLNRVMFAIMGLTVQPNFQGFAFGFGNTAFVTLMYRPEAHKWRLLHFEAPAGH